MQFDYTRLNPVFVTRQPAVGNLYLARGGKPTRFWLVASINKCKEALAAIKEEIL